MKKNTKKSLLFSVLALVLCVAMLASTTLAWFTDSASTGVNKIEAGNLDIEVEYYNDTNRVWKNLAGSKSLFSQGLWEPGHTEFVTLKIENKGTLALQYKALITPVTENGGVNVDGNSFKLSDYLTIGTATTNTDPAFANREAARSAITSPISLNNTDTLKKTSVLAAGQTEYLTLVVYMDENVGNEANYKTDTTPPSIELGINVIATQKEAEIDSFGDDYDSGAALDPFYTVGAYYNYFNQVLKSAPVTVTANNTVQTETIITATKSNTEKLAEVTVPAGAKVNPDTNTLTVKVEPKPAADTTTAVTELRAEIQNPERETANFDIKVEGIDPTNTEPITVEVFVGKGLSNVKIYHNGAPIESTYDASTGYVQFETATFSDFTVAYDVAAAAIGNTVYGSLKQAVDAANGATTITLLKDTKVTTTVKVAKTLTLNLNGYKITGDDVRAIHVTDGTLTLTGTGTVTSKSTANLKNTSSVIRVGDNDTAGNPALVIEQNVTIDAPDTYGVTVFGSETTETVTVKGKINAGPAAAISGNGSAVYGNTTIIIEPTAVLTSEDSVAIYHPQSGTLTINGGKIIGAGGIEAKAGAVDVTITGNPTITATGDVDHAANGNGTSTTGYAIAAVENNAYAGSATVKIENGTFTGAIDVVSDNAVDSSKKASISITGGTFSEDPSDYVADGYCAAKTGNVYNIYHADLAIATVDDLFDFASKVNAGNNYSGKTVILLNDIDLAGRDWIPIGNTTIYAGEHVAGDIVFAGSFNGCGHTISNLSVTGEGGNIGFFGKVKFSKNCKLENVVFNNATVIGNKAHCVGVLAGSVTVDVTKNDWASGGYDTDNVINITVKNSTVRGTKYVGGVVGYAQTDIDNVEVINTKVHAVYDAEYQHANENDSGENAGVVVGNLYDNFSITGAKVTDCTVGGFDKVGGVAGSSHNANKIANSAIEDLKIEMVTVDGSSKKRYGLITGRVASDNGYADRYTGNTASGTATRDGSTITVNEYALP